jgi:hypothetical protein
MDLVTLLRDGKRVVLYSKNDLKTITSRINLPIRIISHTQSYSLSTRLWDGSSPVLVFYRYKWDVNQIQTIRSATNRAILIILDPVYDPIHKRLESVCDKTYRIHGETPSSALDFLRRKDVPGAVEATGVEHTLYTVSHQCSSPETIESISVADLLCRGVPASLTEALIPVPRRIQKWSIPRVPTGEKLNEIRQDITMARRTWLPGPFEDCHLYLSVLYQSPYPIIESTTTVKVKKGIKRPNHARIDPRDDKIRKWSRARFGN